MSRPVPSPETDLLEARFAARVASALGQRASDIPADAQERLRFARQEALRRAAQQRRPGVAVVTSGGAASAAATPWWQRLATLVPLVLLVAGLLGIEQITQREQVLAAAEIDALLLADDIPPDAYRDPGFVEFLKAPPAAPL